jgi:hypothetical protein
VYYGYQLQDQQTEMVTERALVFSYLQEFDLEDVDVRHSATGGWHGTYVGKLAKGNDSEKYSHSSLVKDSMFVDYDMSTTTTTNSLDPEDTAFYEKERDTEEEEEDDNSWEDNDDDDYIHLGPISIDDQRINLSKNPWGTDII